MSSEHLSSVGAYSFYITKSPQSEIIIRPNECVSCNGYVFERTRWDNDGKSDFVIVKNQSLRSWQGCLRFSLTKLGLKY